MEINILEVYEKRQDFLSKDFPKPPGVTLKLEELLTELALEYFYVGGEMKTLNKMEKDETILNKDSFIGRTIKKRYKFMKIARFITYVNAYVSLAGPLELLEEVKLLQKNFRKTNLELTEGNFTNFKFQTANVLGDLWENINEEVIK